MAINHGLLTLSLLLVLSSIEVSMEDKRFNYPTHSWKYNGVEADARTLLFTVRERGYLNLESGLYAVEFNGHAQHYFVYTKGEGSSNRTADGDIRSYTGLSVNPSNLQQSCDGIRYLWDTYSSSSRMGRVRELLPFEKIELMFQMVNFLRVYPNTFYRFHPERGEYSQRRYKELIHVWKEDYYDGIGYRRLTPNQWLMEFG